MFIGMKVALQVTRVTVTPEDLKTYTVQHNLVRATYTSNCLFESKKEPQNLVR